MSEEMKALREQLLRNDKNGYDTLDEAQLAEMEAYCADYKAFLNAGKTERLSARAAIAAAEAKGFVQYKRGMALKAGVQPGFLLAAKAKEGDVKVDAKNIYKTFDLSIPVGLSYDFKFGLILDARYNIGVTNLAKNAGYTRNSVFAVTAGWRF